MTKSNVRKYRKDYQEPAFVIDTILLTFTLNAEFTLVESRLQIQKINSQEKNLVLQGEDLLLKSIVINENLLKEGQFRLSAETLEIFDVPTAFILTITTEIKPHLNTQLSGLYQSKGIYCTQCEAEGFRHITYFLDRPDVMTKFTTKIIANKNDYPYLLSNGNCIESGRINDQLHYAIWEDPFKKPCYLFALVAGDLDVRRDQFVTQSGKIVDLEIYVDKGQGSKTQFAMTAIKEAMAWDEKAFGREYDLNRFMIVAISDFNMGAMENKGLNIFNTKYILADSLTATDSDYEHILSVIGHEYFHNWTGNRITCRDWFQLSLKEGLTIYRDQEFSSDLLSRAVNRIQMVRQLKTYQFPEDAGPMAHPVRPESYLQIDNFYTLTIYEKGAEVIRMMEVLLDKVGFRRGMDLYFQRHDGQAVTIEDFVQAMEDVNNFDLTQFRLWYSQAGTPKVKALEHYDKNNQQFILKLQQSCPETKGSETKKPFFIPIKLALFNQDGKKVKDSERLVILDSFEKEFVFNDVSEKPILSLLRNFSAPIHIERHVPKKDLIFLTQHDDDLYSRWENIQSYFFEKYFEKLEIFGTEEIIEIEDDFVEPFIRNLTDRTLDQAFLAEFFSFPNQKLLATFGEKINIEAVYHIHKAIINKIAEVLEPYFLELYHELYSNETYEFNVQKVGRRALKNICLGYLMRLNKKEYTDMAYQQYESANNMTDRFAALTSLMHTQTLEREKALTSFYHQFQHESLVIDKWFSVQALADRNDVFEQVVALSQHSDFNWLNPNRFRSLVSVFCQHNLYHFHRIDGKAYQFLADFVLLLHDKNPQIAARVVEPLIHWRRFDSKRGTLMKSELERIIQVKNLSSDVFEIVEKGISS